MNRIGIIGAGQMGSGIATVCALAGFDVRLVDRDKDQLAAALKRIKESVARRVARGQIDKARGDKALKLVHTGTAFKALADRDLVIEAVTESEPVKRQVLSDLVPHLGKNTLIATNTSTIAITRLAATTDRPDRFIGVHFMNPVPAMRLVEIIRGIATSDSTFNAIRDFTVRLDKEPVRVEDFPAFIVHRILMPMINEAIYVLYEGVGTMESIDKAMRLGANHPMGPLELADFIGLDTCLVVMQALNDGLADSKYRPCPLLVKYVEAGWLGRKTGRGFYDYSGDTPTPTR
ncbi:MAG: 3-hydroxybutyryl-CoA dehydrogenase [Alphaproteobacteria bacterium]|nr:3-hydroxybutyryl-CoA dehydrogenase [Alphaproteobacteria bacterium]